MARRTAFIYEESLAEHELSQTHPMKPVRLSYTHELLDTYGAFDAPNAVLERPRRASEDEVLTYHSPEYIEAVRALGDGDSIIDAGRFNFGPGDNPAYRGMYDAAMLSTGASLKAAELLVDGGAGEEGQRLLHARGRRNRQRFALHFGQVIKLIHELPVDPVLPPPQQPTAKGQPIPLRHGGFPAE